MPLQKDNNALEGLPLQLLIITIVLAISLPVAYIAFESYDRTQTEQNLKNELDKVISTAKRLSGADVGNSEIVEINLKNGALTTIEEVKIGDKPGGSYQSSIRYKISNRGEESILVDPDVFITANSGDLKELSIKGTGKIQIRFETKTGVDFDGDTHGDTYVMISRVS